MEQTTGKVLFEKNPDQRMAPASITKIMTMLLVFEALDSGKIKYTDVITCSEHANSMGGSQIWFKVGEKMTVDELLRATAIKSANDASVALAEYVGGTETQFADMMNAKAEQLGMKNTHFKNASGLDEDGHYSSARDIAIMSRELMKHKDVVKYTTVWMDYLRNGATQLVNTNKLIRFYEGATGLKTGTTNDAGVCLSATATRGDLSVVAVVLGAANSDDRFSAARGLLDYAFVNYVMVPPPDISEMVKPIRVKNGTADYVMPEYNAPSGVVVAKADKSKVTSQVNISPQLAAPIQKGQKIGSVTVHIDGDVLCEYPITAKYEIEKMTFGRALLGLMNSIAKIK